MMTAECPETVVAVRGLHQGVSLMQGDDTTVRVPLRAKDGTVRAYALIDAADAEFVNQWRWHLSRKGYVERSQYLGRSQKDGSKPRYLVSIFKLHRELLGLSAGDGIEGDHVNRDKLDNRRQNLRSVSHPGNVQNTSARGGSSAYRGVSWRSDTCKWRAFTRFNGKMIHLGSFSTETEAAEAARAARARLMPYAVD
jgi:hypothetical protein